MSSNVEVILGPPGTGKTTALMERLEREISNGTPAHSIAVVTFSRAAREEFRSRACRKARLGESDTEWFKTIHATAFKLLDLKRDRVLSDRHWFEFAAEHGYRLSKVGRFSPDDPVAASPRTTPDDVLRAVYEWGRSKRLDVEETLRVAPAVMSPAAFRRYVERYEDFKRRKNLLDFSDMLEKVLADGLGPNVEVAFIDEAQDLSPLQIRVVQAWFRNCVRVYVAGDDDQAIYAFQGADPGWLLRMSAGHPTTILPKSYRLPRQVHDVAQKLVARNQMRRPKAFTPRDAEGRVDHLPFDTAMKQIDGKKSTLVLVRNRCFLDVVATNLQAGGIPYIIEGGGASNPLDEKTLLAARAVWELSRGTGTSVPGFREMLKYIDASLVPPDFTETVAKWVHDYETTESVKACTRGYPFLDALARQEPLELLVKMPRATRDYLRRFLTQYGNYCYFEPKVTATTIHGAKGREADLVVLLSDMTKACYASLHDQRHGGAESENRVAYVGVTRAKERLIIVAPRARYAYPYPRVTFVTDVTNATLQAVGTVGAV